MADRLTDLGVKVSTVVARNRLYEKYHPRRGTYSLTEAPETMGEALAVEADAFIATLAYRPALGWVFDIDDDERARRWHLGPQFARHALSHDAVPATDVQALANRVKSLVTAGYSGFLDTMQSTLDLFGGPDPLVSAAAWWLREIGAHATRVDDFPEPHVDCPGLAVTLHRPARPFGLPALQRAVGVAAVRLERAVVFSTMDFTRDATRFADEADVPLIGVDTDSGRAWGISQAASDILPRTL